jgi:sortase A
MPLRGSAQLLLLFLARGKRRGIAGAIAGAVVAGLFLGGPAELTQALRERAWDRALAESPAQSSWPWTEASAPARAKVQRLGLSAAVVKDGEGRATPALYEPRRRHDEATASQRSDEMLDELAVGDHITVTSASGDSRSYRVAGPSVVDPHLAQDDPHAASGDDADSCAPHDRWLASSLRLVIQAITADPPAPKPDQEQKL